MNVSWFCGVQVAVYKKYSNNIIMKGTKVQTLGACAVAGAYAYGAWLVLIACHVMAMGAIINTHAHR